MMRIHNAAAQRLSAARIVQEMRNKASNKNHLEDRVKNLEERMSNNEKLADSEQTSIEPGEEG